MILYYLLVNAVWHTLAGPPSCLQERSNCLRNPACSAYFESFERTCGYTLTKCTVKSPSDCARDLYRIRDQLSSDTCVCYRALGFVEECDFFRQLVWNHPCERLLLDVGQERRMTERMQPTETPGHRRTTRAPAADQARELKTQLSGELETRELLGKITCDEALERVCLRHVSCGQLWRLFRSSCGVDEENQCVASDRQICWQAFEGLSWTGLANCRCETNNSDCHWIRLHTNYNKCIYEISKSGKVPLLSSQHWQQHNVEQYQRRYEQSQQEDWRRTTVVTPARYVPSKEELAETERQRLQDEERQKQEEARQILQQQEDKRRLQEQTQKRQEDERRRVEEDQREQQRRAKEELALRQKADELEEQRRKDQAHFREKEETRQRKEDDLRRREEELRRKEAELWRREQDEQRKREELGKTRMEEIEQERIELQRLRESLTSTAPRATQWPLTLRATMNSNTPPSWWEAPTKRTLPNHSNDARNSSRSSSSNRSQDNRTSRKFPKFRTTTTTTTATTTTAETPMEPTTSNPLIIQFITKEPFTTSTCPLALTACENAEECRWHLGELRARCGRVNCRREECAAALQRFSRYVPITLSEQVMFCQCAVDDTSCTSQQELLYPRCLYNSAASTPTCTQTAARCSSDSRCKHLRSSLTRNCPVDDSGGCVAESAAECRRSLLAARGSILEQPCFCPLTDVKCVLHQKIMIPGNPCIEDAIRDFGKNDAKIGKDGEENEMFKNQKTKDYGSGRAVDRATPTTSSSTTTTTSTPKIESRRARPKHRTTASPPTTPDAPPPWEMTTTTKIVTTTFVTQPPPPAEGCQTRDANGRALFFPVGTILRKYVDWSTRCSSWCECVSEDQLQCERLDCLTDGQCEAPLALIDFGERIYLKERGACFCESSSFICELPEEMPELYPGLYIAAGFSEADVELLRKEVPRPILDKAGLYSSDPSTDIAGRLQVAFERLVPEDIPCRLVLMNDLAESGQAFFRVEWFGMNEFLNHTKTQWHHGGAEKACTPYVNQMYDMFSNSDSLRYQLVLSTVKQIKILDYLDGLPTSSATLISLVPVILSLVYFS